MAQPFINNISPVLGNNGVRTFVTVTGRNFESTPSVFIGDTPGLNITRTSDTLVRFEIPSGLPAQAYDIRIVNPSGEEYILSNGFRVIFPLPSLPFASDNREVIAGRMLQYMRDQEFDIYPGSFVYELVNAAAAEIDRGYARLEDSIDQFYPQTARLGFLDLIGETYGLNRTEAKRSEGTIRVTGEPNTRIPANTVVSTSVSVGQNIAPVYFVTLNDAVIESGETVDIGVRSRQAGSIGNVNSNTVVRLESAIAGVTGLNNTLPFTGGDNAETDEEFRVRLLNYIRYPAGGGNINDYISWCNEVPGIQNVRVVPLGRGNGTVDVYIVSSDFPSNTTTTTRQAVLTFLDTVSDDDTVTIGGTAYRFKNTIAQINDVHIETEIVDTLQNLVHAINATGTAGTDYFTGTTANINILSALAGHAILLTTRADPGTDITVTTSGISSSEYNLTGMSGGDQTILIEAASSNLVSTAQTYINQLRPVGADVDVFIPDLEMLYVTLTIDVMSGHNDSDVRDALVSNLQRYINSLLPGDTIKIADLRHIAHTTVGVDNYRDVEIYKQN